MTTGAAVTASAVIALGTGVVLGQSGDTTANAASEHAATTSTQLDRRVRANQKRVVAALKRLKRTNTAASTNAAAIARIGGTQGAHGPAGPQGPVGPHGPSGPQGQAGLTSVELRSSDTQIIATGSVVTGNFDCPFGTTLLSGGIVMTDSNGFPDNGAAGQNLSIFENAPASSRAWAYGVENTTEGFLYYKVNALCATLTP